MRKIVVLLAVLGVGFLLYRRSIRPKPTLVTKPTLPTKPGNPLDPQYSAPTEPTEPTAVVAPGAI